MPRRTTYTDKQKLAYYRKQNQQLKASMGRSSYAAKPRRQYKSRSNYKYPGVGRKIGQSIGGIAGNYLVPGVGGSIGGVVGGAVGDTAQALVKRITGFGDYQISKNSLVYNVDAVPEFGISNERCTMICHREFITDISGTTSFALNEYRINPAISDTFPWLSAIAKNYEQYVVQGMVFEFKTTSATAIGSTNTSLGTVVMATQYNSLAPDFTNKQQMENYEFSQSSVPSQSILHAIECDPSQTQCGGIFNMYNPNDDSGDTRLYDIGKFNIATVGMQAASIIGELWVSYKICLLKPRLASVNDVMDGYTALASTITEVYPIGTLGTLTPFVDNSGFTSPNVTTANRIDVDPGYSGLLQVTVYYNLSSTITTSFTMPYISFSGNGSNITLDYLGYTTTDLQTQLNMSGGAANKTCSQVGYFRVDGGWVSPGVKSYISVVSMQIGGGTAPYFDKCVIFINSIPSSFDPTV